ncbi:MAG: response regulator [Patescibacteria group bacterium]|nr:response regulator [Patescibacteria group bacterium]
MEKLEKNSNIESNLESQEKLKTIFLIDDNKNLHNILDFSFQKNTNLLHAYTLEEAQKIFCENLDIDLILIDGCLNENGVLDTVPFVKMARQNGFQGIIIAMSSDNEFNTKLVEAGCDKQCDKLNLFDTVLGFVDPEGLKRKRENEEKRKQNLR